MQKKELVYYVAFTLYFVINMLYTTSINNLFGLIPLSSISTIVTLIIYLLLGYLLVISINKKYWLIIIVVLTCVLLVTFNTRGNSILSSILFILTIGKMNIKKLAKYTFYLNTGIILVAAFCAVGGLLPMHSTVREAHIIYALGFVSYNTVAIAIFRSILLYCLIKYESLKVRHFISVFGIGYLTYFLTRSRIAFYTTLVFLVLLIYSKVRKNAFTSRGFLIVAELILPFFTFISVYYGSVYFLQHDTLQKLNEFFSGRLYFINYYLTNFGIKIWGQNIFFVSSREGAATGATWFALDNSYAYTLVCFGIVITAILFTMYSILIYNAYKNGKKMIFLYLISMLFVGITENGIFLVAMNFALLYFMQLLNVKESVLNKRKIFRFKIKRQYPKLG